MIPFYCLPRLHFTFFNIYDDRPLATLTFKRCCVPNIMGKGWVPELYFALVAATQMPFGYVNNAGSWYVLMR